VRATADADAESPVACIRRPTATYTSCRCETCRPERNRMRKLTEAGLVPPTRDAEARARLRAWDERGHSPAWIASATGLTVEAVQHLTHDVRRYDRIEQRIHRRRDPVAAIRLAGDDLGLFDTAARRLSQGVLDFGEDAS